jgi:hypothetical protein
VTAIADLLEYNETIKELRTAGNNIRRPYAQYLAEKLAANQSLELLDVSHNDISDMDARYIGKALHYHSSLTHLDISYNNVASKGAITIAYAAQQPDSALRYINFNDNPVGKTGGVYMLRAMRVVANMENPQHYKILRLDQRQREQQKQQQQRPKSNNNSNRGSLIASGANGGPAVGVAGGKAAGNVLLPATTSVTVDVSKAGEILSEHQQKIGGTAGVGVDTSDQDSSPAPRSLLIDFKLVTLPFKDDNIHDAYYPNKVYTLDLSDPYDYTVARMLVDHANRHPHGSFKAIKYLHANQSHTQLWEHIHLARGGLFDPLPELKSCSLVTLWADRIADINASIMTIQAAHIAQIQSGGTGTVGSRSGNKRRQAFRAPVVDASDEAGAAGDDDAAGAGHPHSQPMSATTASVAAGAASSISGVSGHGAEEKAKHIRHRVRAAWAVLTEIGRRLGFDFEDGLLSRMFEQVLFVGKGVSLLAIVSCFNKLFCSVLFLCPPCAVPLLAELVELCACPGAY